jgi:hypothetical protein
MARYELQVKPLIGFGWRRGEREEAKEFDAPKGSGSERQTNPNFMMMYKIMLLNVNDLFTQADEDDTYLRRILWVLNHSNIFARQRCRGSVSIPRGGAEENLLL